MLVPGRDVLELDTFRAHELERRGRVVHRDAPRPDQLDDEAGFFLDFAESCLVGKLVRLDMASRRQPQTELSVRM